MHIEEYFNFLAEDDIRIKGTRIGIETVLDEYIHNSKTPEEIADQLLYAHTGTGLRYNPILSAKSRKSWCVFGRLSGILPNGTGRTGEKSASRCYSPA